MILATTQATTLDFFGSPEALACDHYFRPLHDQRSEIYLAHSAIAGSLLPRVRPCDLGRSTVSSTFRDQVRKATFDIRPLQGRRSKCDIGRSTIARSFSPSILWTFDHVSAHPTKAALDVGNVKCGQALPRSTIRRFYVRPSRVSHAQPRLPTVRPSHQPLA